ncbi:hypothetical protein Pcinc_003901 [Petrolisthes cinctipes]|uniref:RNase H type-1 domain-containing protein n=1 Tax=Petrolisthes cinctipes TaxID=88211 RepID=A0AAE1GI28_PETCI|nr:hypothetical protein Pcinc_003901 [Petrolisthes cinctipes]
MLGSAFVLDGDSSLWRTPDGCSTLQIELVAIGQALKDTEQKEGDILIISDSSSAIATIRTEKISDTSIQATLQRLSNVDRLITFLWIPSHKLESTSTGTDSGTGVLRRKGPITTGIVNTAKRPPQSLCYTTSLKCPVTAELRNVTNLMDINPYQEEAKIAATGLIRETCEDHIENLIKITEDHPTQR